MNVSKHNQEDTLKPNLYRKILELGGICAPGETPEAMIERVTSSLFAVEQVFGTPKQKHQQFANALAQSITDGECMLGSPILSHAGRSSFPLSSCVIPPVTLTDRKATQKQIQSYFAQRMGMGFNLSPYKNPLEHLLWLNKLSSLERDSGQHAQYVGSMGILNIRHPSIREFLKFKTATDLRNFNISIDVDDGFLEAAANGNQFTLSDGTKECASSVLDEIAAAVWQCGDPGMISLDRLNHDNPITASSRFVSMPPCAEMGLALGETCQFGYINLSKFVTKGVIPTIRYGDLEQTVRLLTRVLDNAVEISVNQFTSPVSREVAIYGRRIAIGIVGLADLFLAFKVPYGSPQSCRIAQDIMEFINYTSKAASVVLAKTRGSCKAMQKPQGNKYLNGKYLEQRFGHRGGNGPVAPSDWNRLAASIRANRSLRNITTTAIPPSGRISLLLGATPSIEPFFSIQREGRMLDAIRDTLVRELPNNVEVEKVVEEAMREGSFSTILSIPPDLRACLRTAIEIAPEEHLSIVAALAGNKGVIDGSISKTVNLAKNCSIANIRAVYESSFRQGLRNISVYRDGSKTGQPMKLSPI